MTDNTTLDAAINEIARLTQAMLDAEFALVMDDDSEKAIEILIGARNA